MVYNTIEKNETANTLLNSGFSKASMSLAQILRTPILLEKIDIVSSEMDYLDNHLKGFSMVHVIKTDFIGNLKGSCYLIINETDVSTIINSVFPSKSEEDNETANAFLTEVDNMLAAAVITEFSNFLKIEFYGNVPDMKIMEADKVIEYLIDESKKYDALLHFKAVFNGPKLPISPHFLWMVDEEFVNYLNEFQ